MPNKTTPCSVCGCDIPEGEWGRSWWIERDEPSTTGDESSTVLPRKKRIQLAEHKPGDCIKALKAKVVFLKAKVASLEADVEDLIKRQDHGGE